MSKKKPEDKKPEKKKGIFRRAAGGVGRSTAWVAKNLPGTTSAATASAFFPPLAPVIMGAGVASDVTLKGVKMIFAKRASKKQAKQEKQDKIKNNKYIQQIKKDKRR